MRLTVYDNIQFIYEIVVAERELRAGGLDPALVLNQDRRSFDVPDPVDAKFILRSSAYIRDFDEKPTDYAVIQGQNQTRAPNQYLTHWFYPYKGKFHPQVIRALINIIGLRPGEVLLDPYVGSGTAALEAQLLGVKCVGIDMSPLCALITRVKTQAWQFLSEIKQFGLEQLNELLAAAEELDPKRRDLKRKEVDYYEFALPVPGRAASPTGLQEFVHLAWLIAVSDVARRQRAFAPTLQANWDKMVASVEGFVAVKRELNLACPIPDVRVGDARQLPLDDGSVDGIVTSPPYSIALNYVKNDEHALMAMGMSPEDASHEFIGVRGKGRAKYELYEEDLKTSIDEMARVLRPRGRCAIIIGNKKADGEELKTTKDTKEFCERAGLVRRDVIPKAIYGLYNIIQDEEIIIYEKPD